MATDKLSRNIFQWVKKQCFVERKQGRCTRIVLHHVGTNGKLGAEICTVNVGEHKAPGDMVNEEDCHSYTADVVEDANQYAEGIGATQSFALAAYFEDDPESAVARYAFRINVTPMEEEGDVSSEPANLEGITKQLMRHLEAKERMQIASFGTVLSALQNQNKQLNDLCARLMEERVEQAEAFESLISGKHARDLELQEQETGAKLKERILDNLMALAPAMANKLLGRKILPETTDVTLMQVVKLVEALTPQDLDNVVNSLDGPEKRIAFVELIQAVQLRQKDEAAASGAGTALAKQPS